MELITGRTGTQHVKAIDDAEIYRTLLGNGDFVLSTGQKLNAQMSGTSQVNIQYGTAIMQGRQCKIRQSEGYNAVSIDNGIAGYKRWDVICIEYTIEDNIENAELVVVKGANSTSWVEPTVQYTDTSIDAGETHRMKLWGVKLDGINFDSLVDYRTVLNTSPVNTMLDTMTAIEEQIEARITALEAYAMTAPHVSAEGTNVTTTDGVLTLSKPSGYTYENTDTFVLYLNGLRVMATDYSITVSSNIEIDIGTDGTYAEVILEVWKAVE